MFPGLNLKKREQNTYKAIPNKSTDVFHDGGFLSHASNF